MPPALGGYLQPGSSGSLRPPSGGPPGTPPSPAQQQQAALQQLEAQIAAQRQQQQQQPPPFHQQLPPGSGSGLGTAQPSLASSISGVSSTGLTHGAHCTYGLLFRCAVASALGDAPGARSSWLVMFSLRTVCI
jgi:hypothetical protein